MRWGIYGTIAAVVLFIIPGINLLCFGLLIIAGSVVSSLGVPDPFKEASACLLVELTFMFFFTAFRVAQIVCFHYLARLFSK